MKKLIFIFALLCGSAFATNHYILPSGTGSQSGGDWSNAYNGFGSSAGQANPASLTCGDVYYVGTGTYALPLIQTSCTTPIVTIKGATAADHGTATGWSASLGVDVTQATFTTTGTYSPIGIFIWYGGVTVDGNTGTPAGGPTSYGFTIALPASCAGGNSPITIGAGGSVVNEVHISHFYLKGCSGDVQTQGISLQTTTTSTGLQYDYNYFDGFQNSIFDRSTSLLFDHNYIANSQSFSDHHGNGLDFIDNGVSGEVNPTISNNIFTSCNGTVCMGANDSGSNCAQGITGAQIYGNIFNVGSGLVGDGIIGSTSRCFMANSTIVQNVFAESTSGWLQACVQGQTMCSSATGNLAENNIIWNGTCALNTGTGAIATHDYNSYLSCTDTAPTETHGQVQNFNPFVNTAANNFALTADGVPSCSSTTITCTGLTLGTPYTVDPNGVTRGADGTWERGAIEFSGGGPPLPPTGLTATVSP